VSLVAPSWVAESVTQAFARFNDGDVEGVVELCDPEIELTTFMGHFDGRSYLGRDGIREWFADVHRLFSSVHVSVHSITEVSDVDANEVAIVEISFTAVSAADGISVSEHLFQRIESRERRAIRWSWHPTLETALGPGEAT
jgi:ketosteroid isomerase-like protein